MVSLFRTSHKRKEVVSDTNSDAAQLRPGKLARLFRCLSVDASAESVLVPPKKQKPPRLCGLTKREKQYILTHSDNTSCSSDEDQGTVGLAVDVGTDTRSTSRKEPACIGNGAHEEWVASFDGDLGVNGKSKSEAREDVEKMESSQGDGSMSEKKMLNSVHGAGSGWNETPERSGNDDPHPIDTLWLWEHIEQLTERKALAVARFQASLAETSALKKKLREVNKKNAYQEECIAHSNDEQRCLEFHKGTVDARCIRLENELSVLEKDMLEAVRIRHAQKALLDERMKQLMESQKTVMALREQKIFFGTETDVAYKCMRDDLWGLHSMYASVNEETKRQTKELEALQVRLARDSKERGIQEQELGDCLKRLEFEKDREKELKEELRVGTQELESYKQQLNQRTQEAFDLQKWANEAEVENAKMEAGAEGSQGVESLIRGHVLPALRSLNEQMPALERTMTALSIGETIEANSENEATIKNLSQRSQSEDSEDGHGQFQHQKHSLEAIENCPASFTSASKAQEKTPVIHHETVYVSVENINNVTNRNPQDFPLTTPLG